jgi:transcriptional regulator with XRE-family HTH domain
MPEAAVQLPLADRLREARREAGMTNRVLAERLGLTERTILGWQGAKSAPRSRPSYEKLVQLAEVLDKPVSFFLEEVAA